MELKDISVLIDGYNLELPYNTGIKSYGQTLIEALKILKANVSVLFSKGTGVNKGILKEILFFDNNLERNRTFKIGTIRTMLKAVFGILNAQTIENSNTVIKKSESLRLFNDIGIVTLKDCYRGANILYKKLGIVSNISTSQKIDVWHATYPLPIKIKKSKKITTIHDLIPLRLPYTTLDNKKYFYKIV
ncbi:MAG: glycosyltransferase family 1 protein, partial [Thermodesulfovibrionales bacterium]